MVRPTSDFGERPARIAAGHFGGRDGVGRGAVAGRFEALHRVLHPRRDHYADGTGARGDGGRAPARNGQYGHPAQCARKPQHRCLSRIHRHDRARDPQAARRAAAGGAEYALGAAWPGSGGAAGLQQQLRACGALERCTGKGPRAHFGPQAAPRTATRTVAGVSRPRRWLAQSGARLRPAFSAAQRARPRARL